MFSKQKTWWIYWCPSLYMPTNLSIFIIFRWTDLHGVTLIWKSYSKLKKSCVFYALSKCTRSMIARCAGVSSYSFLPFGRRPVHFEVPSERKDVFLLLLLNQVLQMCDNAVCITMRVWNAISWVFQLHVHLVDSVIVDTTNFVPPQVVEFLLPPMFIINKVEWVFLDWYDCICKVIGRVDLIVEDNKETNNQHHIQPNNKHF